MSAIAALIVTLLIVLANAFFVAAEFAFVRFAPPACSSWPIRASGARGS